MTPGANTMKSPKPGPRLGRGGDLPAAIEAAKDAPKHIDKGPQLCKGQVGGLMQHCNGSALMVCFSLLNNFQRFPKELGSLFHR